MKSTKSIKAGSQELVEIENISQNFFSKRKMCIARMKSDFVKTKYKAVDKILSQFPEAKNLQITISPSLWGTVGSYSLKKGHITIQPRYDRKINNVYMLLVTALTHYIKFGYKKSLDNNSQIWKEKQLIAAYYHRKLGFDKGRHGMVNILEKSYSANLAKKSCDYYQELGFPIVPSIKNTKMLTQTLTKQEKLILKHLIQNKNSIITFDEIASLIWKEKVDEKYSLYAITKTVERLRKSLKRLGIEENIIHTQRGLGYFLFD